MSSGLITLVSAGSTTLTITRPGGHSTTDAITASAPASLDHLTYTLSSSTATVGGSAPTGTVHAWQDAGGTVPFTGSTSYSYTSSNTAVATINSTSGVITLVAAGSCTFTVTDSISSKTATTGTLTVSASGTVTSASVYYTGPLGTLATPQLLMRTGSTYTLIAKDQAGNTLDGSVGSWASSDATNAPINSSTGVVSPSGVTGATFTYTHTASGVTAIAKASVFPPTTAVKKEAMSYTSDSQFRGNIANTVTTGYATPTPTGTGASLYTDGANEGAASYDSTRPFMAGPSILMTFNSTVGNPILRASLGSNYRRAFALVVKRYDNGFTTNGDGTGGAASYKDGPFLTNSGAQGRAGIVYSNTNGIYGEAMNQSAGSFTGGVDESSMGSITTEWTDASWYVDIIEYNAWQSVDVQFVHIWRVKLGDNPKTANKLTTSVFAGANQPGVTTMLMNYVSPLGENYNRGLSGGLQYFKSVGYWEVIDGVTYGDPLGIIQDTSAPTLTGISGGSVAHGSTSNTIVLTGTNFNSNTYPVFSNSGITAHYTAPSGGVYFSNVTVNSSTQMTVVVDVAAGATIGAGTVYVRNDVSQQSSGTQTVTVT